MLLFDDIGPFGLVLTLMELLRAEMNRCQQAKSKRRAQEPRLVQADLFSDLLQEVGEGSGNPGVAESILAHRIRVQCLVPSAYELAVMFAQALLWEWCLATGDPLPTSETIGLAFPAPEVESGPSFL
jgi:hypothetical protein